MEKVFYVKLKRKAEGPPNSFSHIIELSDYSKEWMRMRNSKAAVTQRREQF